MSIRSESLPMRGRLSYQLEDLLRRNGMSAQLAVEDGRYKLLVQGHEMVAPTMPTRKPIMSSMALSARTSTSLRHSLQPVMSMAVLPWGFMVTGSVWESMGGLCLSVPMPLVLDSLDGCRDNSPASIFVVSAMCLWSWSILTDAYAQES